MMHGQKTSSYAGVFKRFSVKILDYYNVTAHSLVCNKLSGTIFLSTASPFPGRASLLQGSQASPFCASGNSGIKLSVEYRRNDPDGVGN